MPLVLAGPMLRKVTQSSVTVWLAMREPTTVTLEIRVTDNLADAPIGTLVPAQALTTRIGPRLHLVAVTARLNTPLAAGAIYFYHLQFQTAAQSVPLVTAVGVNVELTYPNVNLPSFATPPDVLSQLRLYHGSCRKPNADGPDALAILDKMIEESVQDPLGRPHQLIMSGDQIYADEVADVLLMLLTEAGETLIGVDPLPLDNGNHPDPEIAPHDIHPTTRGDYIKAIGFTTVDYRSHLMSLGEFLAMYLFVWSDTMWPPSLSQVDEDDLIAWLGEHGAPAHTIKSARSKRSWMREHWNHVRDFAGTVGKIRRALANVPTYMIFDDHDVTDDWNMYRSFVGNVHTKRLGTRVVQNALCAYALCQHWGNAPEQFRPGPNFAPAGSRLLDILHTASSYADVANNSELRRILGIHTTSELLAHVGNPPPFEVFHDHGTRQFVDGQWIDSLSLLYNYSIVGPVHVVVVTDTRTWRSFPRTSGWEAPDLISRSGIVDQIENAPAPGGRQLMLVVSTNLLPGPGMRQGARDLPTMPYLREQYRLDDLSDAWEPERIDFSRLLTSLARHVGRSGSIVVLSGDVHTSSAARVQYWADAQIEESPSLGPAQLVLAQLIGSPFHNGNDMTAHQHTNGYAYVPNAARVMQQSVAYNEALIGWNPDVISDGQDVGVQKILNLAGVESSDLVKFEADRPLKTLRRERYPLSFREITWITTPPTYRVLLSYVPASSGSHFKTGPLAMSPGTTPLDIVTGAATSFVGYAAASAGSEIVGRSNIGEVRFVGTHVAYTVHWREGNQPRWMLFEVSLRLNDLRYPRPTYPGVQ
ncbi:MAG: hypothetical protein IT354_17135 [Gemmatimonadaceae bacterium]|nr:hypothetical protein [Gemmatimonadaceae bacterium]